MIFNEETLREDIIKTWGKSGSHLYIFNMMMKKIHVSEMKLIEACKYGYDFHKTTQFPELEFEKSAVVGNFKQKMMNDLFYAEGKYFNFNLDYLDNINPNSDLDNDDLKSK